MPPVTAEITCTNPACVTCVRDAYGEGAHFWHWQLVKGLYTMCPHCGKTTVVYRQVAPEHKFALGQIVVTPGVLRIITEAGEERRSQPAEELHELIGRHARGDWGDVDSEDAATNNDAIEREPDPLARARVLSSYLLEGEQIWIITEAGRHATTIMLPEEY